MPFSGPDKRQKVLVLLAMCFALFMAMLDNTVVNVALPTLSRELGAGVSGLQWIIDGYILAFAGLLLTGGTLGDRYGRKRAFLAGLGLFTLASLLCGLSQSTGQLIAFRALQGVGGALLMPGTLAILSNTFPIEERAQAIGIWAGVSGLALAAGPTAGGWIIEHIGWEAIFFLNVPIGLAGLLVAARVVTESREPEAKRLDVPGVALGTAGLVALTYGLIESNQYGWTSPVILGALGGAAALLVVFVLWERRTPHAMMPLSFFRIPAFTTGNVVAFSISFAMFGTFFFLSLYFQLIKGYTALEAGLHILPITGMIFFTAPVAGKFAQRYGSRWPLTLGLTLTGSGLLLMTRIDLGTSYRLMVPILMMMGLGMASSMTPMTAAVMNAVGPARAGLGAATTNTSREVGGVVGIALLGTLLYGKLKVSMAAALSATALPAGMRDAIVDAAGHGRLDPVLLGGLSPADAGVVKQAYASSFMDGFHVANLIGGLLLLTAAVLANRFISAGATSPTAGEAAGAELVAAH